MKAGPPKIIFGGSVHIFNFTLLTPDATSRSIIVSGILPDEEELLTLMEEIRNENVA